MLMYSDTHRITVKYDIIKISRIVVAVYLFNNSNNKTAAEGSKKIMTKYIFHILPTPFKIEANNFYEKISIARFRFAE